MSGNGDGHLPVSERRPAAGGRVDASPEPGKVKQMFDSIADSYDRMNDLMTAGLHHRWREMGVMLTRVGPGRLGAGRVLRHR